jgi:hypothetical protein
MRVEEAKAALERAGYGVSVKWPAGPADDRGPPDCTPWGDPGARYDVEGLATAVTEEEFVKLAHRHGAWRPAFERAHSAGPKT